MLHSKKLPLFLWAEAVACAVYTLNRVVSKAAPSTPYFAWHQTKPDVSNLRVFGCVAFVHVPASERQKLDPKSVKCIFLGYSLTQKAYRFWDGAAGKVRISRDAIFDECRQENYPFFLQNTSRYVQPAEGEYNTIFPLFCTSQPAVPSPPATKIITPEPLTDSAEKDVTVDASGLENNQDEREQLDLISKATHIPEQSSSGRTPVQPTKERRYPLRHREQRRFWQALHAIEPSTLAEVYEPAN